MKKLSKWLVAGIAVVMGLSMTALTACDGADGKSAYEIAVENGFEGTESEWLESLKGANGSNGTGENGKDGNVWFTGNGLPVASNTDGAKTGDFYINLNTNTIYRYGDDGWSLLFNISEYKNVSVWDGTIPGWQAPDLTDEEIIKNRPASYVVNESNNTVDIYNAEAFAWFAYRSVIGKTGFKDYTVSLHCDIDLNNKLWVPIGLGARSNAAGVPFQGTFNGNGHTIYNLDSSAFTDAIEYDASENKYYIPYENGTGTVHANIPMLINHDTRENDDEFNYGLFCTTKDATIKNLNIANVKINVGRIQNESFDGAIIGDSVGAIVGYAYGSFTMENCTAGLAENLGKDDICYIRGEKCFGGLVGRVYAGSGDNDRVEPFYPVTFKNCVNYLEVTSSRKDDKAGGIVGFPGYFSSLTFENCVNYGKVKGANAGGLFGFRGNGTNPGGGSVNISGCVNYGDITGRNAGGLVGVRMSTASNKNTILLVSDCKNYGVITGVSSGNVAAGDTVNAGGLFGELSIGKAETLINNCVNYGTIRIDETAPFAAELTIAKANLGGLFGSLTVGANVSLGLSGMSCGLLTYKLAESSSLVPNVVATGDLAGLAGSVTGTVTCVYTASSVKTCTLEA